MSHLPTLLKNLGALHRQQVQIERDIADAEREILAVASAVRPEPKSRRKRVSAADVAELVKDVVILLRDAGDPLSRQEIASRLGMASSVLSYRLQRAVGAGFVEKVGRGHYRVSSVAQAR